MPKFTPQRKNANKHTLHGTRLLEKSVQSDGWIDAQTAAADGEMISGTARLELGADKFADVEPIIVESDGTRPVIVVRTDIPNLDDPRAKRLSVAANQITHTDYNPDGDLLKEWGNEDAAIKAMFAESEWAGITGEYGAGVFVLGSADVVGKDEGRSGASPWDRVVPSDRRRCLIGDIEFGIKEDVYNAFLGIVQGKENTVREEAQLWLETIITS